jgi:hypothetical protein
MKLRAFCMGPLLYDVNVHTQAFSSTDCNGVVFMLTMETCDVKKC